MRRKLHDCYLHPLILISLDLEKEKPDVSCVRMIRNIYKHVAFNKEKEHDFPSHNYVHIWGPKN